MIAQRIMLKWLLEVGRCAARGAIGHLTNFISAISTMDADVIEIRLTISNVI
jgi:hypothetical protein